MPQLESLELPPEARLYVFNHILFPPELPQEDDCNPEYDSTLLDTVVNALRQFESQALEQHRKIVYSVTEMMSHLVKIQGSHGEIDENKLRIALRSLATTGDILPIHIRCQNAAVLLTREPNAICVETFELSPQNEAVTSTVGRLQRQFPGPSFCLDISTFQEPDFQNTMAQTLAKMSHQSAPGTKPKVWKGGREHDEDRDTDDPKMVIVFLTTFCVPAARLMEAFRFTKTLVKKCCGLIADTPSGVHLYGF
ncbi:hypothetical protein BJX64DRAFT_292481 [Aspergillus heterothallicus]